MKGIVLCFALALVAISYTNGAPVDTPRNISDNKNAIEAKASASVSKRNNVDPYATIKSYIHPHRKRRRYHKRHHKLHRRVYQHRFHYPVRDHVAYFGKGNKGVLPAGKSANLSGVGDHEDFEVNNGEVFEHGAVPDLRRNAVPPIGSKRALTVHNGEKASKALARDVTQQTEDNHANYSTHSKDQGSGDDKNTLNDDAEEIGSSGNNLDDKPNMTVLDKTSESDAAGVTKSRKNENILLSDHVVFLLSNATQVDNSSIVTDQKNNINNKTEPKFLTLSRFYGLGEKNNHSVTDNSSKSLRQDTNQDIENLNNLHNLIKDLVSLDKSIYLVEHTLSMADDHNKSNYNQFLLNNDNYSGDSGNMSMSEFESNSNNSGTELNNKTMNEVHANVEDLVLRCLGFGSRDKLSPLLNNSVKDNDIASTVHTSAGDLVLSCSDFDISKDQSTLLNPLNSLHLDYNADNITPNPFPTTVGDVMNGHSLQDKAHHIKKVNISRNLTDNINDHKKIVNKLLNKKLRNIKMFSGNGNKQNKQKQFHLGNINKTLNHISGDNKSSANKSSKSFKPNVISDHDMEEKIKQDLSDNSTVALFKNYGLHNGTDPRLRELINDVINLDNTTTYYYSYSSEPNNHGVHIGNDTVANMNPLEEDTGSHKHTSSKYHNHSGDKIKGTSIHNHVGEVVNHAYPTNSEHNETSSKVYSATEDKKVLNKTASTAKDCDKKNETNEQSGSGDEELTAETNLSKSHNDTDVSENKTESTVHNDEEDIHRSDNSTSSQEHKIECDYKNATKVHTNVDELVSHIYAMQSDDQRDATDNKTADIENKMSEELDNSTTSEESDKINGSIADNKQFAASTSNVHSNNDSAVSMDNKTDAMKHNNDENIESVENSTNSEEHGSGDDDKAKVVNAYNEAGDVNLDGYIIRSDTQHNATDNQTEIMYHDNDGYVEDTGNTSISKQHGPDDEVKNVSKINHNDGDMVLHDNFMKANHLTDGTHNKTVFNKVNNIDSNKALVHNKTGGENINGSNESNVTDSSSSFTNSTKANDNATPTHDKTTNTNANEDKGISTNAASLEGHGKGKKINDHHDSDEKSTTKTYKSNGYKTVADNSTSSETHDANNDKRKETNVHDDIADLSANNSSTMFNVHGIPIQNKTLIRFHNTDEGTINSLTTSEGRILGNDKIKENNAHDIGNTVFQDYLMNPSGHSVAIGNITAPKLHTNDENMKFDKNATTPDDHKRGYSKPAEDKHAYGTGVLISHGYLAKSKIATYKTRSNNNNNRKMLRG